MTDQVTELDNQISHITRPKEIRDNKKDQKIPLKASKITTDNN